MKKVLTIGSAMLDLFLDLGKNTLPCIEQKESRQNFMLLEVGRKLEIPSLHRCSGGGATNAAVSFSRQGFQTTAFFKTGVDCESEFIEQQLTKDAINTHLSSKTQEAPTGISLIFPCPEGDRTTLTYRGANLTLTEQELPLKQIHNFDCLYITSLSGATEPFLVTLVKEAQAQKKFIAVNPGSNQLRAGAHDLQKALPHIDVLIMNSEEALECLRSFLATGAYVQDPACNTNKNKTHEHDIHGPELLCTSMIHDNLPFNLRHYFVEILKRGPKIAVVTNGKEGVYIAHGNTLLFHPSLPAEVVNTLGAGDAFGSSFVGALLQDLSIEQALIYGLVQAAAVISVLDAQSGLLTADELKKRAVKFSMDKLQRFSL